MDTPSEAQKFDAVMRKILLADGPSFRAFGERVGFRAAGDDSKSGFFARARKSKSRGARCRDSHPCKGRKDGPPSVVALRNERPDAPMKQC